MLQKTRKTWGFKKIMVYKIPPGGGGKPYLASGLNMFPCVRWKAAYCYNLGSKIYFYAFRHCWGPPRGTCSFPPWNKLLCYPVPQKSKSWFSMFPVPQNCLCSPIALMFVPFKTMSLFPCSPKTPGRASLLDAWDRYRQEQSCSIYCGSRGLQTLFVLSETCFHR